MEMHESVSVEIYGRTYSLRAQKDKAYIEKLAKMVNDKMTAVEQNTNTVDTVRVAVLAALNLADESCSQEQVYQHRIEAMELERARLLELIEGALEEGQTTPLPDA